MNREVLELVERARGGQREAFEELIRRHRGMVRGLVCAVVRGRLDTDDLVQETFLEAWRSLRGLREPLRFLPWLQGVARNACRRELRKRRAQPQLEPLEVDVPEVIANPSSATDDLFGHLPNDMAQVMRAKFCEDRSYREIARRFDMTLAQVRNHMEKGLRLMARRLSVEARDPQEVK